MDNLPIVSMKNVCKKFGGTAALDNVSIDIYAGEIHSFVGVNGAGKSTLMRILFGACHADIGKLLISGTEVVLRNPIDAMKNGISMVFQDLNLFDKMSIAENILMGNLPMKNRLIDFQQGYRIAKEFLDSIGINYDPRMKVEKLNLAGKQLIEIAKSVYKKPKILILDEPSSSLSYGEAEILYKLVHHLKERGLAIIFITHKMEEILKESDRITIIRDGKIVANGMTSEYDIDKVTGYMLGQDISIFEKKETKNSSLKSDIILSVRNLSIRRFLDDINFDLRKQEILAITGLVGSGKSELGRTIFGIYRKTNGKIVLNNKEIKINSPIDAIKHGIGYLPISRKEEGIFTNFDIRKNITISILDKFSFFIKKAVENNICKDYIKRMNIKPPREETMIGNLSGGNQQKVVLARWLVNKPKILILDEPTRGIDVGAKHEIYTILKQLVEEGISVIIISSEFEEILNVADRVLIMHEGHIIKELNSSSTSRNEILRYAMAGNS